MLHNAMYIIPPKRKKKKQKAHQQLSGAGIGVLNASGYNTSILGNRNVLELNDGDKFLYLLKIIALYSIMDAFYRM